MFTHFSCVSHLPSTLVRFFFHRSPLEFDCISVEICMATTKCIEATNDNEPLCRNKFRNFYLSFIFWQKLLAIVFVCWFHCEAVFVRNVLSIVLKQLLSIILRSGVSVCECEMDQRNLITRIVDQCHSTNIIVIANFEHVCAV